MRRFGCITSHQKMAIWILKIDEKLPVSIESCQDAEQLQFVRLRSLIELVDFDLNYEVYTINLSVVLKIRGLAGDGVKKVYGELWLFSSATVN